MRFIPYSYLSIAKRCKNGYHKNPETGQCEPKNQKGTSNTSSGCQEGFHQHAGYKNCHEIWKPHKAHTLSCNQHRLLGIPCRYKGEILDANGRPVEKGIPTKEWLKQAKERKEKEKEGKGDNKENESDSSKESVKPHIFVSKTGDMVKDVCKSLSKFNDYTDSVLDSLRKEPEDGDYIQKYRNVFKDVPWVDELDFRAKEMVEPEYVDKVDDVWNYILKECEPDIIKTIESYPLGLLYFSGLQDYNPYTGEFQNSIMATGSDSGKILFGFSLFVNGLKYVDGEDAKKDAERGGEYSEKYDPITGELTKWAFHPHTSTMYDSLSHEWGHVMLNMFMKLKGLGGRETEESEKARSSAWKEVVDKFTSEIYGMLPENVGGKLVSDMWDSTLKMLIKLPEGMETKEIKNKKVRDFAKSMGFKVSLKKEGYQVWGADYTRYRLIFTHEDAENQPWHYSPKVIEPENLLEKYGSDASTLRKRIKNVVPSSLRLVDFNKEIESLYKEIYDVEDIIPSDVYSGYGYLATNTKWKEQAIELAYIAPETVHERVAEAFSDVIVRGDKANSMSNLLVAGVQYYVSALMQGNSESFTDYFHKNFNKEDFGERIIKYKYINQE